MNLKNIVLALVGLWILSAIAYTIVISVKASQLTREDMKDANKQKEPPESLFDMANGQQNAN